MVISWNSCPSLTQSHSLCLVSLWPQIFSCLLPPNGLMLPSPIVFFNPWSASTAITSSTSAPGFHIPGVLYPKDFLPWISSSLLHSHLPPPSPPASSLLTSFLTLALLPAVHSLYQWFSRNLFYWVFYQYNIMSMYPLYEHTHIDTHTHIYITYLYIFIYTLTLYLYVHSYV